MTEMHWNICRTKNEINCLGAWNVYYLVEKKFLSFTFLACLRRSLLDNRSIRHTFL